MSQEEFVHTKRRRSRRIAWSELTVGGKIATVISDLLFTFAFFGILYVIWLLYWTAVPAYYEQRELASSVQWDEPDNVNTPATPLDMMPCEIGNSNAWERFWGEGWKESYNLNWVEPNDLKAMIGRVYIPRFGNDYVRNLVQGTDRFKVLDRQGFGHYQQTVMPGCVGNFASAAHRDGYGAPLGDVETFRTNDAVIIRTKEFWYVYQITSHEVVDPSNTSVLLPVPNQPTTKPTKRIITLTTCHPRWSMKERYIQYGEFKYWAKVRSGVPQEMLDAGTKVYE